jgi:glycosyltransferase involved in cell wall biosynthesis
MKTPRICIVSHAAYRALTGSTTGHIGGVEHQTSLLARWLVARGYAVDFITWREGDEREAMIDGIRLLTICRQDDGLPGLRFVYPRWTSLVGALRRSNADVYYHNTAECVTGQVGFWCWLSGRRFVFSAASHADCDAALPCLPRWRERVLYRLGLRLASAAVVQTEMQQQMMRENFGRDAEVIPMPCPEPEPSQVLSPAAGPPSNRALWVGRLSDLKRPELFLAAAAQAPDLAFDLVGPLDGAEYGQAILEQARSLANVTYHGAVARSDMPRFYRRAGCLVCTSHIEGFPNTFLEAWSQGLPIVSTWDPDGLIRRRGLGVACDDAPAAVANGIRALIGSAKVWSAASARARAYYLATHRPEVTFEAMARALAGDGSASVSARTGVAPA